MKKDISLKENGTCDGESWLLVLDILKVLTNNIGAKDNYIKYLEESIKKSEETLND